MDMALKDRFIHLWGKYFNGAELPIVFYYANEDSHSTRAKPGSQPRCLIGALAAVRQGKALAFDKDSIGCPGGKR